MTRTPPSSRKHWLSSALLFLTLVAASCSVPNFEFAPADSGAAAAHCSNQVSDEGETGVDCGGTCPGCSAGGTCLVNNDCLGTQCVNSICQDASCTDGVQSGNETDIDCGGGACAPCSPGQACASNRDCSSNVCANGSCSQPSCVDKTQNEDETDTDCGGSCPSCLPGQHCKIPTDCAGGNCTDGVCSLTCLDGKGNCDGDATNGCETNLKADPDHCGACDTPCNLPNASAACSGGKCAIDTCKAPFADCDGDPSNGCEVNTKTDAGNCSGCGTVCATINGTPSCANAKCQIDCTDGFSDCDGDSSNGCETSTAKDVTNCGQCGNRCDTTGGSAKCTNGVCGVSNCATGLGDCDDNASDCETDITTSADNCGGCGVACVIPNGTPSCVNSACKVGSCNPGYADCDGIVKNGCETNIGTDAKNCGSCGTSCTIANATAKCVNQVCQVSSCTAPFADCDGNSADCETDTSSNAANCGGCSTKGGGGTNCQGEFPNATGKCVSSSCVLDKCATNFADCNKNADLDGCEANLKTSGSNCGACGTTCQMPNGSNACNAGTCVPSCGSQFGNCDANPNNGCEAVFANDPNNCGSCKAVCQPVNGTNVCSAGACSPTCSQSYFKSCDSNASNGCETDDRTNKANCGGCGMACQDNNTSSNNCASSACSPACLANYGNCDGNNYNGCETATASDVNNCGACNVQCKAANASKTACSSSACNPSCNDGFAACSNAAAGCLTSIDTAAHCGNCGTACTGGTPFCVSRACAARLSITVVNSSPGAQNTPGANLSLTHALQNSAVANAYRLVLVGVTGYGNNTYSLPTGVTYNNVPMTLAEHFAPANQVSTAVYYMLSADLPATAGSYPVVVVSSGTNSSILTANVVELSNVEQATTPIDAMGGQSNPNSCTSHEPADSVTIVTPGALMYSVASVYGTAVPPGSQAVNPNGQVVTQQVTTGSLGTLAGYLATTGTGARTLSWNVASCNATSHALIAVRPAITP